jgi:hypothetical protein
LCSPKEAAQQGPGEAAETDSSIEFASPKYSMFPIMRALINLRYLTSILGQEAHKRDKMGRMLLIIATKFCVAIRLIIAM